MKDQLLYHENENVQNGLDRHAIQVYAILEKYEHLDMDRLAPLLCQVCVWFGETKIEEPKA